MYSFDPLGPMLLLRALRPLQRRNITQAAGVDRMWRSCPCSIRDVFSAGTPSLYSLRRAVAAEQLPRLGMAIVNNNYICIARQLGL